MIRPRQSEDSGGCPFESESLFGKRIGDLGLIQTDLLQASDHFGVVGFRRTACTPPTVIDGVVPDQGVAAVDDQYEKSPDQECCHGGPAEVVSAGFSHLEIPYRL